MTKGEEDSQRFLTARLWSRLNQSRSPLPHLPTPKFVWGAEFFLKERERKGPLEGEGMNEKFAKVFFIYI